MAVLAAGDAQGRGGARLHAGQQGIVHGKTPDLLFESGQCLADRIDGVARQCGVQRSKGDPWCVRRQHRAELGGGAVIDEIADQLRGCRVVAATERECLRLPMPLQGDAGKRTFTMGREILRVDPDHDAGVGIALVA